MRPNERAVLVRFCDVAGEVLPKEVRSLALAEDIKLASVDQPALRVSLDELALGQRHGAEVRELRRVADGIGPEKVAVLGAREPVPMLIPLIFDLRQAA